MVFDWDDFCDDTDSSLALALLYDLKDKRDDFKCTLFAIPGRCTPEMLSDLPGWIELAVHGWTHPDPHECQDWSRERTLEVLDHEIVQEFFVRGWKSPGWNVSDGTYQALLERGYWIADHPKNNDRRPDSLRVHLLGSPGHHHGHIGNVCGNGIQETWEQVVRLVGGAEGFEFMSERLAVPVG